MYASIRRYTTGWGVEVTRKVQAGFVPVISKVPGFVHYYAIDAGEDSWLSVSIFETKAGAEQSNEVAADWLQKTCDALTHLGDTKLLIGTPDTIVGEVVVDATS